VGVLVAEPLPAWTASPSSLVVFGQVSFSSDGRLSPAFETSVSSRSSTSISSMLVQPIRDRNRSTPSRTRTIAVGEVISHQAAATSEPIATNAAIGRTGFERRRRGRRSSTAFGSSIFERSIFERSIFERSTSGSSTFRGMRSLIADWMSWRFISRKPSGSLTSGRWISGRVMSGIGVSVRCVWSPCPTARHGPNRVADGGLAGASHQPGGRASS
jgi:hypothetical protein